MRQQTQEILPSAACTMRLLPSGQGVKAEEHHDQTQNQGQNREHTVGDIHLSKGEEAEKQHHQGCNQYQAAEGDTDNLPK